MLHNKLIALLALLFLSTAVNGQVVGYYGNTMVLASIDNELNPTAGWKASGGIRAAWPDPTDELEASIGVDVGLANTGIDGYTDFIAGIDGDFYSREMDLGMSISLDYAPQGNYFIGDVSLYLTLFEKFIDKNLSLSLCASAGMVSNPGPGSNTGIGGFGFRLKYLKPKPDKSSEPLSYY